MSQEHAEITEEMIADVRRRIGVDWRPREPYFNVEATQDTIRHFAHGIGDDNPLWCDHRAGPRCNCRAVRRRE